MAPAGFVSHPGLSALLAYMPEFPGNAPEGKPQVIKRIARQWASVALAWPGARRLLVEGKALQDGHGRLYTRRDTGYLNSLRSLVQLRPMASVDGAAVWDLAHHLGLDPHSELEFAFMQTNTLVVFGTHKKRGAVAHLALHADRDAYVLHGARNLACLGLAPASLSKLLPKILQTGRLNARAYTIQTRLPGETYRPDWSRKEELRARIDLALAPLSALSAGLPGPVPSGDSRGGALAHRFPHHARLFTRAEAALSEWRAKARRSVPIHGDYGFHNLLFDANGALSGIVDWDRLRLDGDAHFDALHLLMNAVETAGLCTADGFLIGTWAPLLRDPRVDTLFRHVLERTCCSESDARFVALAIWLELVDHGSAHAGMSPAWRVRLVDRCARLLVNAPWLYRP